MGAQHYETGYHRRADDPPDARYGHVREKEVDKIARFGTWWDRYIKFLLPFLWAGIAWFFLQLYPAVKGYPVALQKLEAAEVDREKMNSALLILVKLQCIELDERQRAIAGLDCTSIRVTPRQLEEAIKP